MTPDEKYNASVLRFAPPTAEIVLPDGRTTTKAQHTRHLTDAELRAIGIQKPAPVRRWDMVLLIVAFIALTGFALYGAVRLGQDITRDVLSVVAKGPEGL